MSKTRSPIGTIGACMNHVIKQGATFGPHVMRVWSPLTPAGQPRVPMDLTGKVVRAQMRRKGLDAALALQFDAAVTDAANGRITYGATAAATATLTCGERVTDRASKYVWDMEMEDTATGVVTPLLFGDISVFRQVTR